MAGGTGKCWGSNLSGGLGDGTTTSSPTAVAVGGLTGAVSIAAGGFFTCARFADGTAKCWGSGGEGQLGDGKTTPYTTGPASPVSGLAGASALATSGGSYACALVTGAVKCWGYDASGQLGDGSTTSSPVPVSVKW